MTYDRGDIIKGKITGYAGEVRTPIMTTEDDVEFRLNLPPQPAINLIDEIIKLQIGDPVMASVYTTGDLPVQNRAYFLKKE